MRKIFRLLYGVTRLYSFISTVTRDMHAADMLRRQQSSEEEHRRVVEEYFQAAQASGRLGDAREGTFEDAQRASLVNGGEGQWIGAKDGVAITWRGGKHRILFGKTGSFKSAAVRDPLAIGYTEGTPIFIEIKDGEAAFVSARYRAKKLKNKIILINPDQLLGWKGLRFNPLYLILTYVSQGKSPLIVALGIAHTLWPLGRREEENWAPKGAQRLFCAWALYTAWTAPAELTLSNAYLFATQTEEELIAHLEIIAVSDAPGGAARMARTALSILLKADKQWAAIHQTYCDALIYYTPGEPYAEATSGMDVDFAELRQIPCAVYVLADAKNAEAAGPFVALVLNSLIEGLRDAPGPRPCLFVIDEFTRLPRVPALIKGLDNYRSRGLFFFPFCHSRDGLIEKYGRELAANFEAQSGVVQFFSFDDTQLLRDLEYLSGKKSVVVRGASANQGTVASAGFGAQEHVRPLFQVEDLRRLTERQQLVLMPHQPMFVMDRVPWFEVTQWQGLLADARTLTPDTVLPPIEEDDPPSSPPPEETAP